MLLLPEFRWAGRGGEGWDAATMRRGGGSSYTGGAAAACRQAGEEGFREGRDSDYLA